MVSSDILMSIGSNRIIKKGLLGTIAGCSPLWMSYGLGLLCHKYISPLKDGFLTHLRYKEFSRFLDQSQWWLPQALEDYQNRELRALLEYAYNYVPYYTELFNKRRLKPTDFKTIGDLSKLPILTKEEVRKNFYKLISKGISQKTLSKRAILRYTSGSTGSPLVFLRDRKMLFSDLAFYAWYLSLGHCRTDSKHIRFWSRPFIERKSDDIFIHDPWRRRLSLSTVPRVEVKLSKYLKFIKEFEPVYVTGSPALLYTLACYARDNNYTDVHFPVFFNHYENLYPFQRKTIEEQFRCEVFNYYASEEFFIYAIECSKHEGMHIETRKGVMEIIGNDGEILPPGERGRIVYTGFNNHIMPLIRYDTGDIGIVSDKQCSCGRGLPLLKSLDGRTSEVIKFKNKYIYPATLSLILERCENIKECQFVQEKEDRIKINIVRRERYSSEDTEKLTKILKHIIDEELNLEINFVDKILRSKMGKFRFVINHLAQYN